MNQARGAGRQSRSEWKAIVTLLRRVLDHSTVDDHISCFTSPTIPLVGQISDASGMAICPAFCRWSLGHPLGQVFILVVL